MVVFLLAIIAATLLYESAAVLMLLGASPLVVAHAVAWPIGGVCLAFFGYWGIERIATYCEKRPEAVPSSLPKFGGVRDYLDWVKGKGRWKKNRE